MWRDGVRMRVEDLDHPAWGWEHCARLYDTCRHIVDAEKLDVDDDVLYAIAWLHDLGTFPEYACEGADPPECAARAAEKILPVAGFPSDKLSLVTRIIREHNFEGAKRDTAEARVLRDADMLEFLGAIGLVRLLSIAENEEWVPDKRSAIALAIQFAQDLPDKIYYAASRRIAEDRVIEQSEFLAALAEETAELQVL